MSLSIEIIALFLKVFSNYDVSFYDSLNKEVLGQDTNQTIGPSGVALLKTIEELKQKLENARAEISNLEGINEDHQVDLEEADANA